MSRSGVGGRGRGWLNLSKNQNNVPTPASPVLTEIKQVIPTTEEESQFSDVCEYKDLISRIKELDVADDGIKFNQKIKYILENWKQDCLSSEEVEKSFDALYQGSLNDDELASKLVIMISSRSFISQEVHDQNIRLIFLRKLQNDFEGSKIIHRTNPTAFRNSVRMLGEFYHKARLVNGQPFTFMLTPLLSYLEMLLESAQVLDLQQFASQLFLNGTAMKTECAEKLNELFNKVRTCLASDKKMQKEAKLWLLFSLEMYNNKFGMLPIETCKFYQDQIGGKAMALFQGTQSTLSVQTPEDNKTLENYQSNVNVLQLSTKPEQPAPVVDQNVTVTSNSDSTTTTSGVSSDTSSKNSSNTSQRDNSKNQSTGSNNSGKYGRPILGAGARLNKNKFNDSSNWREKDNATSGWGKKSGWGNGDKKDKAKNKGWEHDDRFENDYS